MRKAKSSTIQEKTTLIENNEILDEINHSGTFVLLKKALSNQEKTIDEIQSDLGRGIAHFAAIHGNLELIRFAKANHADFNITDNYKSTPLHYASMFDQTVIVRELVISCGVCLNPINNISKTPLDLSKNKEIIDFLQVNGAKTFVDVYESNRKEGFLPDISLDYDEDSEEIYRNFKL